MLPGVIMLGNNALSLRDRIHSAPKERYARACASMRATRWDCELWVTWGPRGRVIRNDHFAVEPMNSIKLRLCIGASRSIHSNREILLQKKERRVYRLRSYRDFRAVRLRRITFSPLRWKYDARWSPRTRLLTIRRNIRIFYCAPRVDQRGSRAYCFSSIMERLTSALR